MDAPGVACATSSVSPRHGMGRTLSLDPHAIPPRPARRHPTVTPDGTRGRTARRPAEALGCPSAARGGRLRSRRQAQEETAARDRTRLRRCEPPAGPRSPPRGTSRFHAPRRGTGARLLTALWPRRRPPSGLETGLDGGGFAPAQPGGRTLALEERRVEHGNAARPKRAREWAGEIRLPPASPRPCGPPQRCCFGNTAAWCADPWPWSAPCSLHATSPAAPNLRRALAVLSLFP